MPPRYAYWTILAGGLPTSFRAADRADLLPTLKRLQERHPDAEMKWFQRGRLWASPEAARAESERSTTTRGREWRPGGEHRDRRETFRTKKRERNQERRQQKFVRKHGAPEQDAPDRQNRQKGNARKHTRTGSPRGPRRGPRQTQKGGRHR